MAYELIQIDPLSPTIGVEIGGVDLRELLPDPVQKEIHRALLEYKVIFFRDQDLTTEQHLAFARRFGDLEVHPFGQNKPGYPEVLVLLRDENNPGVENIWHSDVTWRLEPSLGSVLHALDVPQVGGDTLFADMYAAYEGMSDAMQRMCSELVCVHDFTHNFGRAMDPKTLAEMQKRYPKPEHPVIRTHPETGRKGIYVNAAFSVAIEGMRPDESRRLLEQLYAQARTPEYQCRFRWRQNSIAFWDNRAAQHYAAQDYYPATRHMERVTIVGDRPH